jgi:hypothetical protein
MANDVPGQRLEFHVTFHADDPGTLTLFDRQYDLSAGKPTDEPRPETTRHLGQRDQSIFQGAQTGITPRGGFPPQM